MILAADVGATRTRLGLFRRKGNGLRCEGRAVYPSREFASFERLLAEFLDPSRVRVSRVAIGVAGPVENGRSRVVNLRWPIDAHRVARRLRLREVHLLNDLEATAWSLPVLGPRRTTSLTPGLRGGPGNRAVLAAGSGLGMAILHWDGCRHEPCASEGGHQSFAPRDELEVELWHFLKRRHGRVSVERTVSGPALSAIYEFLKTRTRGRRGPKRARRLAAGEDPNVAVAEAGLSGEDRIARRALDCFISLYGAAAGDLALVAAATGGVYVAGGIAQAILPRLRAGGFMRAFRDKGRLSSFVARIPVHVVLDPMAGLLGAAHYAATKGENR